MGEELDFNEVFPGVCVGADPPPGGMVREAGFDLLVLTAWQRQHGPELFPGLEVCHAPLTDDAFQIVDGDWERARAAAERVVVAQYSGKRSLITCVEGRNRSGLVAAIALATMRGNGGQDAIDMVQRTRPGSLYNWHFQEALRRNCSASAAETTR